MRAPISVLIPTLNAAGTLGPLLAAICDGMAAGLVREVILADGGSADGTREAAQLTGARLCETAPGRGYQLAAGAELARGDWLLVLHADTALPDGWMASVAAHIRSGAGAGYFDLSFDAGGLAARLVAGWANLRARLFGLPYGDQGLLLPMSLYRSVGGYPHIPLMEDVALARALHGRLAPIGVRVTTSASRYRRDGWLRRGWRNLTTLGLYFAGVDPAYLAKRYR
ncbi:MAG: TIGR04283 family arsenosugar biosynthesis glycosyltransferase [Rhodobacteraceae bacterium]|nr:TIGR04283 family arsenosugar biosynthesis glycosyltransferase [Paracoccaceae bacterium]